MFKLDGQKHSLLSNNKQQQHPFNGPLSGTTRVSQYQKDKTNQDFTEARDKWVAVASAGPYASLHLTLDRYLCQHPITQFFYRLHALPATQPTVSISNEGKI